jgi:HEAT repeat protein
MQMRQLSAAIFVILSLTGPALAQTGGEKKTEGESKKEAEHLSATSELYGKNLDQWIGLIPSKDRSLTESAIKSIVAYGPDLAIKAVPALIAELGKHNPPANAIDMSVRVNAPVALGLILSSAKKVDPAQVKDAVKVMQKLLRTDSQQIVKYRTIQALAQLGPQAHDALPELIARAKEFETWETREAAVIALGTVGIPQADAKGPAGAPGLDVVNALTGGLNDASFKVRLGSMNSLMNLRVALVPEYKPKMQKELEALIAREPDPAVKLHAHVAVFPALKTALERKRHIDATAKFFEEKTVPLRVEAIQALAFFATFDDKEPKDKAAKTQIYKDQAADELFKALSNSAREVKLALLSTLSNLAEKESPALKARLERELQTMIAREQDPICQIRAQAAAFPLLKSPLEKKQTLKTVAKYMGDKDGHVRCEAAQALGHLGKDAADEIPTLVKALLDNDFDVVGCSIAALSQMHEMATSALPQLASIMNNENMPASVRAAAHEASDIISGKKKDDMKKGDKK